MTPSVHKAAELEWKLASLPEELKRWRAASEPDEPFEKHHSQIRRLALQMEGLQAQVDAEFEKHKASGELLRFAASIERRALAVHTVWDFFRSKFALRAVEPIGSYLKTADAFAQECYGPSRPESSQLREPPLVTFDNKVSPWAISREGSYRPATDPGGFLSLSSFAEVISKLPIPLLGIPWHYATYLPHMVFLAHESGHAIERDSGMEPVLIEAVSAAPVDPGHKEAWVQWHREMFADVFAVRAAGPAYVASLSEVLMAEPDQLAKEVRTEQDWTSYPTAMLRMLANIAALEQSGFPKEAADYRAEWLTLCPRYSMESWATDVPMVVQALYGAWKPPSKFGFGVKQQRAARQVADYFRQPQGVLDVYPVRVLIAAARELMDVPQYWGNLISHAVTAIPPGLLDGEPERIAGMDEARETAAGAQLAKDLFRGLDE